MKIHSTLGRGYQLGNLTSRRTAIAEDVDHSIPEIPLSSFMEHLLPPLKDGINVSRVVASLAKRDRTLFTRRRKSFKDFQTVPAQNVACENETFAPLGTICRKVCEHASSIAGEEQTCHLELRPDYAPWSERNSSTRPDAYFMLRSSEWYANIIVAAEAEASNGQSAKSKASKKPKPPALSWYDILFPGEVKKNEAQEDQVDVSISRPNVPKIAF